MSRKCLLTGARPNSANNVSHSNIKTKKRQLPNLQNRRFWWVEGNRWVQIKVTCRAMRTIDKIGLQAFADSAGVDLSNW